MRCSVVCRVTLRLLAINITSSSPAINTAAYYQRCVTTCGTVAVVHRRPRWQHLLIAALTAGSEKARYRLRIAILPSPPAFDAPVWGVPIGVLLCVWHRKKTRVMVKKFWWCIYLFVFTNVSDTHKQTDRQTPHDGIAALVWFGVVEWPQIETKQNFSTKCVMMTVAYITSYHQKVPSTVLDRLRNPSTYPAPSCRTKRYQSFINYGLLHYQHVLLSLSLNSAWCSVVCCFIV